MNNHALVLFSGGQDSTTCLAWALQHFDRVATIGFDYRQRHKVELACRPQVLARLAAQFPHWQEKLGADHVLDVGVLGQISETALTKDQAIILQQNGLPSSFVPGRNLLFLTLAAALAYRENIPHLVGGMCETDFSGYPDCRDAALQAFIQALNAGMASHFTLHTPLMALDKAATWQLARMLGGAALLEIIRHDTHTCYNGVRETLHPWGYGCNACPACDLRREGYAQFSATLLYQRP